MLDETTRPGTYVVVLDALTTGRMTVAQAAECYRVSVKLYGEGDGQSIGYRRAIVRHLSD